MQKHRMPYLSKYKSFNIFFVLIIFANLLFFEYLTEYRVVSKPMIMASLIGLYISQVQRQNHLFLMAMIMALLGDIFLLFQGDAFFMIGLCCFLIMQGLYYFVFKKDTSGDKAFYFKTAIPILLTVVLVLAYLWSGLQDMRWPVAVYAFSIGMMAVAALHRKRELQSYCQVAIGVVFFMISDILLGVSKFGQPFFGHEYLIIFTYMIAQYLIVTGIISTETEK